MHLAAQCLGFAHALSRRRDARCGGHRGAGRGYWGWHVATRANAMTTRATSGGVVGEESENQVSLVFCEAVYGSGRPGWAGVGLWTGLGRVRACRVSGWG